MKNLLLLPLAIFACAASPAISFNYEELKTYQLQQKSYSLASDCVVARQSEKSTKHDQKACTELYKIYAILKSRGLCWGPNDVPNYKKNFLNCSDPKSEDFQF